jgi:hypothetical protein
MPFPLTYRLQHREKTGQSVQSMIAFVEEDLLRAKVTDVTTDFGLVRFKTGILNFIGTGKLNPVAMISSGELEIMEENGEIVVTATMRFTAMLIISSLMVFGFMGSFMFHDQKTELKQGIPILIAGWLWIFGINYLVSTSRIRTWVKGLYSRSEEKINAQVPWWKFSLNSKSIKTGALKPFEPNWQPLWLRRIPWRWKMLLFVNTAAIAWNGLLAMILGRDGFFGGRKIFEGPFSIFMALNGLMFLVAPYFAGRALEKWNEKVAKK